jgi:hypothetical protein
MVEITYQMMLSTLQTIALIVGIVYYLIIMRNSQRTQQIALETRQAQLLMQIYQRMSSPEYVSDWAEILNYEWDSYEDFELKYGSADHPKDFGKRASIWRSFDGIGLLVKQGLLDVENVYELLDSGVIFQWMKWESIIKEQRIRHGFPNQNIWFEYLAGELLKIRSERGVTEEPSETFTRYPSEH